jgi:predicted XRE-type DNA-binding protein
MQIKISIVRKVEDKSTEINYELGSENVFADLEMADTEEKLAKAELVFKINQLIEKRRLKQKEAAKLLQIDQSKVSLLNRGRLSDFSIERLIKYLNILDQDKDIDQSMTRYR